MRYGGFCISIVASDWGQCVPWNGIISAECYCLATDPAQQLPSAQCLVLTPLARAGISLLCFHGPQFGSSIFVLWPAGPLPYFQSRHAFGCFHRDPSLQTKMTIWHMKASDLPGIQIGFQMFLRSMLSLEEKNSPDNVFVDNYLKGFTKLVWCIKEIN